MLNNNDDDDDDDDDDDYNDDINNNTFHLHDPSYYQNLKVLQRSKNKIYENKSN